MKLVAEQAQQQGYVFWRTIDPTGAPGRVVVRLQWNASSRDDLMRYIGSQLEGPIVYQYIPPGFGENRHPNTGSWNDPWLVIGSDYYSAEVRAIRDVGDRRGGEWVRYYFTAPANDAREYAWIQSLADGSMTLFRCDGEILRPNGQIATMRLVPRQVIDLPTIAGAATAHAVVDLELAFAVAHAAVEIRTKWLKATGRTSTRR